jgi:site-specific DNA-methyltransferase (adenine-specific)/modification methylase
MRVETIGRATLYLGDCRDILPTLGKVGAVVTDPPYGIDAANGASEGGTDASGRYLRRPKRYEGAWDDERPPQETFDAILSAGKQHIIWGGNFFADLLPQGGRWLFWDKLNSMPTYSDGEMAWTSIKGSAVKKFTQCNNGLASLRDGERCHPTQKPVNLMSWCLTFAPDAQTILDPFMGSGTTGVAAVQMQRDFIGIEREPNYFDIACRRIEDAQRQGSLFGEAA